MSELDDLVGPKDIAAMFRVEQSTVAVWRLRHKQGAHPFPQPVRVISGHKLFSRREVVAWGEATGRNTSPTKGTQHGKRGSNTRKR